MAQVVRMPRMSDTMEEGIIVNWLKKEGDLIKFGDILAEVETDKAIMELESSMQGHLLYVSVKRTIPVNGLVAIIGYKGEDVSKLINNLDLIEDLKWDSNNEKDLVSSEKVANLKSFVLNSITLDEDKKNELIGLNFDFTHQFYKILLDQLKEIIKNQSKIIFELRSQKQHYLDQTEEIQNFIFDLEDQLGLEIHKPTSLKELSPKIKSHFQEIELFEKFLKEKSSKIEKWMEMLATDKTENVIKEISNYIKENNYKDILPEITQISSNWYSLKHRENKNLVSHEYADQLKSKLNFALIGLIHEVEKYIK